MKKLLPILISLICTISGYCQNKEISNSYISFIPEKEYFLIFDSAHTTPVYYSKDEFKGVIRAIDDLANDLVELGGNKPQISTDGFINSKTAIVIGTIGKSSIIDGLISTKKLKVNDIAGKWETFIIQTIEKPFKNVERILVIAGSDKRGTIFGIYDLCEQMGISPWYWWADVKPWKRNSIYLKSGKYIQSPSVKYRGIFLNDEYPNLTRWVQEKYGTAKISSNPPVPSGVANYNHVFYAKIFELILRLKGNYLWPAMWNNAFNEDDTINARLADEYGIVMGTSHQEPMLRAQKEWDRRYQRTLGYWNYAKYPDTIKSFWRQGIKRNKNFESIITLGLRGANDTEMAPGGPEANKNLLENIVQEQRKILEEELNSDITKVPQMWCLYKEVLDYYKAGMRVPDDVTLLWAEDNWGNIRRLPTPDERKRSGGAGIYYHFDYHGGPRSYQWINTNPIPKLWDQLSLAKQYGADHIWIVNVGHLRGYEFPMEYFFNLAWNTYKYTPNNIRDFTYSWAVREFGIEYASDIAEIITLYTKYNGRRKPELLSPATFSLTNYNEAENVVNDYNELTDNAENIYNHLPSIKKEAFYHLVLFPVKASALVNKLYLAASKNELYSRQGRASANDYALEIKRLFSADTSLMSYYNRIFANGKWNHFMDQSHLGYTSWNDPPVNNLNAIHIKEIKLSDTAEMALSIENSEEVWPGNKPTAQLPVFDNFNKQIRHIDLFNKGNKPFDYLIHLHKSWITLDKISGHIEKEARIRLAIDWTKAPKGSSEDTIIIVSSNTSIPLIIKVHNIEDSFFKKYDGFIESDGYISIEAEHFTKNIHNKCSEWIKIEDYGHTLSGMRANASSDIEPLKPGENAPVLEYQIYLFSRGKINVQTICGPVLNFIPKRAVRYAVAFDNDSPQIITLVPENYDAQNGNKDWEKSVSDNARTGYSEHQILKEGFHHLKIWMIDPGVVIQKIIINTGGLKPSYLGPPESFYKKSVLPLR